MMIDFIFLKRVDLFAFMNVPNAADINMICLLRLDSS